MRELSGIDGVFKRRHRFISFAYRGGTVMTGDRCIVELRPGQGGNDAKLLIVEMLGIYTRAARMWCL